MGAQYLLLFGKLTYFWVVSSRFLFVRSLNPSLLLEADGVDKIISARMTLRQLEDRSRPNKLLPLTLFFIAQVHSLTSVLRNVIKNINNSQYKSINQLQIVTISVAQTNDSSYLPSKFTFNK